MRASTDNYGGRLMTAILRMCSRSKVKSQRRLPSSFRPSFRHVKRTQSNAPRRATSRLRPDAGEAQLARAQNLYWGYLDYDGAFAELEAAAQTLPNDAAVFEL